MSLIKLEQVNDYSTAIAYANDSEVVFYERFGSYQEDWVLVTKNETEYSVYKGYYGSCSGCDSYEAALDHDKTEKGTKEFAAAYKPFAIIPKETMQNLINKGTLMKVFPKNLRGEYDGDVDWKNIENDVSLSVKIDSKLPISAQDVLKARNQETKQKGLKAMGYENFVKEAKPQVLETKGDDQLLKIDDIVFAYVKDSSTPRKYLLRVPPETENLRQAIAWTFGMKEEEYKPLIET